MNEKLIEALYETADIYQGRMSELMVLSATAIQRQNRKIDIMEDEINILKSNANIR